MKMKTLKRIEKKRAAMIQRTAFVVATVTAVLLLALSVYMWSV